MTVHNMKRLRAEPSRTPMVKGQQMRGRRACKGIKKKMHRKTLEMGNKEAKVKKSFKKGQSSQSVKYYRKVR